MPVFGEPMRWVTCVTAPILLADVGDHRFGVFSLDFKRSDERIFASTAMWSVFPFSLSPTVNCTGTPPLPNTLGQTFVDV
jgi:hypothetical protein